MCLEVHILQAEHADEGTIARALHYPLAEAVVLEMLAYACGQCVAFLAALARGEMAHHLGVGIQRGEGRQVVVAPGAQAQARGVEFYRGHGAFS
ncbi:hypothetical protein D3C77_722650 [compost metagenome]